MRYPKWSLRPHDPERIAALSRGARISPLLAQLLINRGIEEPGRVSRFFETKLTALHDPESLPGVSAAAERIVDAIQGKRKIVIYGDYDVDGVCGTSILWACLKLAGAAPGQVEYHIPHRIEEGYGLNSESLRMLATEEKADLVVTVDCGITAVAEAALARELGLELIITDHHTIGPDLPAADVLVHPRLPGGSYPFGDLCGCGVAFKLAWQVCKSFGDGKKASPHLRDFLVESLGLVALATIADVVPLEGENRLLVKNGLLGIRDRPTLGMRALLEVSGCLDKAKLTPSLVGFQIAPRINAAGRLEFASKAVELLTTRDELLARDLARSLDECNTQRKEVERAIVHEARQMIADQGDPAARGAIVVGKEGWHAGVIGIVASRLVDLYHRPTIVASLGPGFAQGSGRSIPGFNLYQALRACSQRLTTFGGHAAAAGFKIAPDDFASFAESFENHCQAELTHDQKQRVLTIDAEVELGMLTTRAVGELESLEPHGAGNPRPLLVANHVRVATQPRAVGEQKNHLQLRFQQGDVTVKGIAWNMAETLSQANFAEGTVCDIAFHASINEWKTLRETQVEIRDIQLCP